MLRFALCGLLLAQTAFAVAFEGRVIDHDGNPVAGAEVSVLGFAGAARTDEDGRFQWAPAPSPPFEILVVLANGTYMSPVFIAELPTSGPLVVRVAPLIAEEVLVTSGAAPGIDATPAGALVTIPAEDILIRQPARIADAIANVPGASTLSDFHASVPSLRGLARGRTLLLIDGARVNSPMSTC